MKKNLLSLLTFTMLTLFGMNTYAQIVFLVNEPSNLAGSYNFTYSSSNDWGADMDTVAITAEVAFAYDASATEDSLACGDIDNTGEVAGKIAILYRGECNFSLKAQNAQDAGAVACIIINNVAGGPVGMGAGTNAAGVVIPVIMISDVDGAALRDSVMTGGVEAFLGNNTGLFANNLGSYKANIGMANSFAIPSQFTTAATNFEVPIGSWVFNYGSADADNVKVTAQIDRDGMEIYNDTSISASILVGDSAFFDLSTYSEVGYTSGYYTITYSILSANTDEFPDDNVASANFWINDNGLYSKSRMDPTDGTPLGNNGIRPADSEEYEWCTFMRSENAEDLKITGLTFSTSTNDIDLNGQAVQLSVYEWNNDISGGTVAFDDLNELTDNDFYDYTADLQNEFVTYSFPEAIELVNDQKYLSCVTVFIDDMFITVDAGLDYNTTYDAYPDEVFFPINNIGTGTWFGGGFGPDNVPAIITNLASATAIAEEIEQDNKVTPYPNPTVDMLNIPFGSTLDGTVNLEVYDVESRMVMSEELCIKSSSNLKLDVTSLASGIHTFNLTFEDHSSTSFKVVITK